MRFDRVLVTGGAGRLGRYVVQELASHCHVSVLDRQEQAAAPADLPVHVPLVQFPVDVLDLDALRPAMRGQHAVVHLAAIDSSLTAPPEVVFDANVRGTWNVLHAAAEAGVERVVICSSSSATGLDYTNPRLSPVYLPIDEDHPLRPSQAYGLSKQLDELMAQSFGSRGGMEVICLRPAWVLFPASVRRVLDHQRDAAPSVSPSTPGRHREPLPLLRSYVDPADAARAFRLALEVTTTPYRVFIVTAADTFEPEPTLPHLEKVYGKPLPRVAKPEIYAANPHASAFDISRAHEILGWSPSSNWAEFSARFDAPEPAG